MHGQAQFSLALAGSGKTDVLRVGPLRQCHGQLTARGDINAIDGRMALRQQRHHGGQGVGLHRVMQMNANGQITPQRLDPMANQALVIHVKRCLACAFGQLGERVAPYDQLPIQG